MFTKKQLQIIEDCGRNFYSLKVAANKCGMIYEDFEELFVKSKNAKFAYETGKSDAEMVLIENAKKDISDQKKFAFLTDHMGLAGEKMKKEIKEMPVKKQPVVEEDKNKFKIDDKLLNPMSLLNIKTEDLDVQINLEKEKDKNKKINGDNQSEEDIDE